MPPLQSLIQPQRPRRSFAKKSARSGISDLSALNGNDDLVNQVIAKYGLEKAQAQHEGRHI
jgi:hypothetical protein